MISSRKLGKNGPEVSALGLGCMGLTWAYGKTNEVESLRVLDRALELGINFLDTAEVYGPLNNEELLGRSIKLRSRNKLIIATKFGFDITEDRQIVGLDSKPAHIKKSIEGSLKRLGTDYIDLYYQHRLDPNIPIEEVIQVLSDLVQEGKIKYIGLSEVGPSIIRRAHKIHPITAVQSEYSIWEREVEEEILPTLKELGIGFVAYSPLGRGFLTGKINSIDNFDETDWRKTEFPRVQDENIQHNMKLVEKLKGIASSHNMTAAQLALMWVLKQGENMVPIPGTKHVNYLEENVKALSLTLPDSEWKNLNKFLESFKTAGLRYSESHMKMIDIQ